MEITIENQNLNFIKQQLKSGKFTDVDEVINSALRAVKEQENKLMFLKSHIDSAISKGGAISDAELSEILEKEFEK